MNSFTYKFFNICVRLRWKKNFWILSYLIKQKSLEWFEVLKALIMTWSVKKHCLEINIILMK